ncbi:hypothetical protein BZZ01_24235 [Nostocales cyanobacterium HT-58-2]|nr:hypothetical protein BZZ01_24235 [Nostocales cyanobacterium HT-58-2]
MKFQAISMGVVLSVAVFTGLTLSHQESAQAQLQLPDGSICIGIIQNGVCISTGGTTQVPTPALLPGLIGLGVGLLRKQKAKKAEVDI